MSFDDIPDWRDETNYPENVEDWGIAKWRFEFVRRTKEYRDKYEAFNSLEFDNDLDKRIAETAITREFNIDDLLTPFEPMKNYEANTMRLGGIFIQSGEHIRDDPNSIIELLEERGKIAVVFDLSLPLAGQMHGMKESLEWWQERAYGEVIPKNRMHFPKLPIYLRVLDASIHGASYSEIVEILPVTSARTEQTARDMVKQAKALCFKDWF